MRGALSYSKYSIHLDFWQTIFVIFQHTLRIYVKGIQVHWANIKCIENIR